MKVKGNLKSKRKGENYEESIIYIFVLCVNDAVYRFCRSYTVRLKNTD